MSSGSFTITGLRARAATTTAAALATGLVTILPAGPAQASPAAISPQQWQNWSSPPFRWQDARFYEYANTGPGAAAADVPQLTAAQARQYTTAAYLAGWWPRDLARWQP